jgi:hypothetical protein
MGAGIPCMTHRPADLHETPEQLAMFEGGQNIIYYDNYNFDALLNHFNHNAGALWHVTQKVRSLRKHHTYEARMRKLLDYVENAIWTQ